MKFHTIFYSLLCSCVLILAITVQECKALDNDEEALLALLKLVRKAPVEKHAREKIYNKDDILFCTGNSTAARANNRAAGKMLQGDYTGAIRELKKALKMAPLFYPYHYNIGKAYYHTLDMKRALLHLQKAENLVPEYYLTYIQIGYVHEYRRKLSLAIDSYREAIHKNPTHLNALVLIGDIYFTRNQLEMAGKYYNATLKIDPAFPNGLFGKGKIFFQKALFHKAYNTFKSIDTSKDYDKALHYYFAECAYKLQDYKEAYRQYTKLLEFTSNKFFITISPRLIQHKQDLAKRFADQLSTEE